MKESASLASPDRQIFKGVKKSAQLFSIFFLSTTLQKHYGSFSIFQNVGYLKRVLATTTASVCKPTTFVVAERGFTSEKIKNA